MSDDRIKSLLFVEDKCSCIETITYVLLQLHVQNAVATQPCVGKLGISLVLLNFLDCNF